MPPTHESPYRYQTHVATAAEIDALVSLMRAFYAEAGYPLDERWAARSFAALIADPTRGCVWLVRDGTDTVGHVVFTTRFSMEYGGIDAFVDDLFVLEQHRRHGAASVALEALFAHCRSEERRVGKECRL